MVLASITGFLGRFHPVLVHLPIGFLIIAILVEWRGGREKYQGAVSYMWLMSAVTGSIAALCGWFLANEGSYGNWTLFFHRWLGIGVSVLAFAGWWFRKDLEVSSGTAKLTNWSAIIALTITGHLGGNMTHGPDYLTEYAPKPIKKLLGGSTEAVAYPSYDDAEAVVIYSDLIQPILSTKCMRCHNDDTQLGGLNMSTPGMIAQGGRGGDVIKPGDLKSELLHRVTLPTTSKKFMPTSGVHMTYDEVKLLEWWIIEGAGFEERLVDADMTNSVKASLMRLFKLDLTPRPWLEKKTVPALDDATVAEIEAQGWKVSRLASNNGWVEVSFEGQPVSTAQLEMLSKAKEQITWLELENASVSDDHLAIIGSLPHLTRLRLQENPITNDGLSQLTSLEQLESLNLVGTGVTEEAISIIGSLPALQTLYLWRSKADREKAKGISANYPDLDVDVGAELM